MSFRSAERFDLIYGVSKVFRREERNFTYTSAFGSKEFGEISPTLEIYLKAPLQRAKSHQFSKGQANAKMHSLCGVRTRARRMTL